MDATSGVGKALVVDDFTIKLFRTEVAFQCRAMVAASYDLGGALTDDEVWFALQSLLVAAANASKLLWGSNEAAAGREDLRASLTVSDASPLKSKQLRNDFEHWDERLELNFSDSSQFVRLYSGRNIGQGRGIPRNSAGMSREFQHFDPTTGVVTFWEHSSSVPELVAEAARHPYALVAPRTAGGGHIQETPFGWG